MTKKGKAKISKVKRNNQTTNKMRKKGQLRLQRHKTKVQKQKQPVHKPIEYSSGSESASGDELADMLDEDEQKYILTRLSKQPQLLSNVPENEEPKNKSGKRKRPNKERPVKQKRQKNTDLGSDSGAEYDDDSDSEIEDKYEKEMAERPVKKMRPLLPIKTKHGILERAEECNEDSDMEKEQDAKSISHDQEEMDTNSGSDSGLEGTAEEETELPDEKPAEEQFVSAVELLAARRDRLRNDKLRIGALCSSLLECPEKKLKNFFPILYLMEERLKDGALNLHSIRKLATLSAYEVFKDVLPEYLIRHQDYSNVKLKKDTLALYKYEKELLEMYKRYLQRLEKAMSVLRNKKGDMRRPDEATTSLALVSLQCMCGMLVSRPNFNFATNIAQSAVPFLDCRNPKAIEIVTQCCVEVFADDKKGDITLSIVRLINQLVKRRGDRLNPAALNCLLTLRISEVDLDTETDLKHKKKQDEKHKKRIVNLSKKEKKRAKKLKEVERELLETEARESETARRKQLTEVVKTVFLIYFRLLKTAPRSRLLQAALTGVARFTHVINLEYYSDLVSILSRLLRAEELDPRARLQCAGTALAVLAGAGDALNVDPAACHNYLYAHMLDVDAGKSHSDMPIVLEAVHQVSMRSRRVSSNVLQAFAKRLCTLATTSLHNGALASLHILRTLVTHSKPVSALLECDEESGSCGRFNPLLESPEHCGANSATTYELNRLTQHYHPTVRRAAIALANRQDLTELDKMTPMQIFQEYDGSQMAFKPSVPPPKKGDSQPKKLSSDHVWSQRSFKDYCINIEDNIDMTISGD